MTGASPLNRCWVTGRCVGCGTFDAHRKVTDQEHLCLRCLLITIAKATSGIPVQQPPRLRQDRTNPEKI